MFECVEGQDLEFIYYQQLQKANEQINKLKKENVQLRQFFVNHGIQIDLDGETIHTMDVNDSIDDDIIKEQD